MYILYYMICIHVRVCVYDINIDGLITLYCIDGHTGEGDINYTSAADI